MMTSESEHDLYETDAAYVEDWLLWAAQRHAETLAQQASGQYIRAVRMPSGLTYEQAQQWAARYNAELDQ